MVATAASAVPAWIPRTCPAALKSTGMPFEMPRPPSPHPPTPPAGGGTRGQEPAERAAHGKEGERGVNDHVAGGGDAEPDGGAGERGPRQPAQAEEPVERRHDRTPVRPLDENRLGVHGDVERGV